MYSGRRELNLKAEIILWSGCEPVDVREIKEKLLNRVSDVYEDSRWLLRILLLELALRIALGFGLCYRSNNSSTVRCLENECCDGSCAPRDRGVAPSWPSQGNTHAPLSAGTHRDWSKLPLYATSPIKTTVPGRHTNDLRAKDWYNGWQYFKFGITWKCWKGMRKFFAWM